MTTHVFIVNVASFPVHLEHEFAGTGARDKDEQFGLLADISRIRTGDKIIFYLESQGFFGSFEAVTEVFLDQDSPTYLENLLEKKLIYRIRVRPGTVFAKGISEWLALDKLPEKSTDVLWSMIYRKLKGARGCTPITIEEAIRLEEMLNHANKGHKLAIAPDQSLTYDSVSREIQVLDQPLPLYKGGNEVAPDVLPMMIKKDQAGNAYESLLQVHLLQGLGRDSNLDTLLRLEGGIDWLANEVACGVGMQKIDIFTISGSPKAEYQLIELKDEPITFGLARQLTRYIIWTESRFPDASSANIQPTVVARRVDRPLKSNGAPYAVEARRDEMLVRLRELNQQEIAKPVRLIEFFFEDDELHLEEIDYLSESVT